MNTKLLLCCAAAALLLPCLSSAQEPSQPPPRANREGLREEFRNLPPEEREARLRQMRERFGQDGAPPGMMAGRAGGLERVFLVLTPEQRESMRKTTEANRDQVRDLEEKLRAARKAIMEAGIGKEFNEAALRQKLEAAAKLDIDLTLLRAQALAKVEPPLSDEQIEKIKNPPPMGEMLRQRQGQGWEGAPGERPFRDPNRPGQRPPPGPRDENDLPPPAQP